MNIPVYIRRRFGLVATVIACAVSAPVLASESVHLDKFPTEKMQSMPALQDGARTFVNYCLNCHSASMMRFNRLQDIGLTDEQISGSLQFTEGRVGDLMKVAMRHEDGKAWFGAAPRTSPSRPVPALPSPVRALTGSTPICAATTAMARVRPAGTTRSSRTWACPTRCGNGRACAVPWKSASRP